jgi:hypothetical protein
MNIKTLIVAALISFSTVLPAKASDQTTLKIYNASNNDVQVFVKLNPSSLPNPGFVQDVKLIPFKPATVVTSTQPLQGYFNLGAGKMVSIQTALGTSLSGTFSFGKLPGPGVTLLPVTVNNNTPAFRVGSLGRVEEYVGINTVPGTNGKFKFEFYTTISGSWFSGSTYVTSFQNKADGTVVPVKNASRGANSSGGTVLLTFLRPL